ncbi:MAG TPA: AAA family ATPase [Patescibacteria group bacterium]|nr:AAA family ATPase [Patescibacteria group bacterium]
MIHPTLFLMVGYPGAGKTTTAKLIHELTGAIHLWADHERNHRFPNPTHNHDENLELYAALNTEARDLLRSGKSVIYDTNFNFYKDRKKLRILAAKEGVQTIVIWITTPKDLARERATVHGEGHTRIWGNMPVERFERISGNLQLPESGEHVIELDGTDLTRETVAQALAALE